MAISLTDTDKSRLLDELQKAKDADLPAIQKSFGISQSMTKVLYTAIKDGERESAAILLGPTPLVNSNVMEAVYRAIRNGMSKDHARSIINSNACTGIVCNLCTIASKRPEYIPLLTKLDEKDSGKIIGTLGLLQAGAPKKLVDAYINGVIDEQVASVCSFSYNESTSQKVVDAISTGNLNREQAVAALRLNEEAPPELLSGKMNPDRAYASVRLGKFRGADKTLCDTVAKLPDDMAMTGYLMAVSGVSAKEIKEFADASDNGLEFRQLASARLKVGAGYGDMQKMKKAQGFARTDLYNQLSGATATAKQRPVYSLSKVNDLTKAQVPGVQNGTPAQENTAVRGTPAVTRRR